MSDTVKKAAHPELELPKQLIVPEVESKTPRPSPPSPIPYTTKEIVYENPKQGYGVDDDDDDVTEEEEEEENVGTVACAPRSSSRRFLDTQYGIPKDGEHLMMMIPWCFRGTEGLWEYLTRKNVYTQIIGKEDLKTYKKILILTNAHLNRYQHGDNINKREERNFAMSFRPYSHY